MTRFILLAMISSCVFVSCLQNTEPSMTEDETWRLGWRLIESSMNKEYKTAELQFDTLLALPGEMNLDFLINGLELKIKADKNEEVLRILGGLNSETLGRACLYEGIKSLKPCENIEKQTAENEELQLQIIKMYVNDQAVRGNVMEDVITKFNINRDEITTENGIAVDATNREQLQGIIKEFGFPSRKLVGDDAMNGLFLIIQHSDRDQEWQKSQLTNIKAAVDNGDLDGQSYAYLYDRIQINGGKKQLYGTQFSSVDRKKGIAQLAPTEDLENLDLLRREVGMMPIDMYKRFMLKPF